MNNPSELLLQVWREACRQVPIEESVSSIGNMLMQRMSLDGVILRAVNFQKSKIETIAVKPEQHESSGLKSVSILQDGYVDRIKKWLQSAEIIHKKPGEELPAHYRLLFPEGLSGDMMAGPLLTEHSLHGVIIFYRSNEHRLILDHKELLKDLLEPLGTVLNNHQNLEQIKILKEAAEADRDSLLTRFGRAEIGDVVIGANKGLKKVMEGVKLVANSDMPVLIFGETGAGKEVIARAIHQQSQRHDAPFIRVNCGAIPAELIDSELFGHERGSFTGATETRQGWFERADGGTLFMDEVGELPLAAQVRLLRVLQDGSFERVGGGKSLHVDVRIVAATHRDLPDMVSQKSFREDLWYRLAVFPVDLPPLRERKEDIPDLARHFAIKAAQRFGLPSKGITDSAMNQLLHYEWPGNVRELATVIERATILSKGSELDIETALGIQPNTGQGPLPASNNSTPEIFPDLEAVVKNHIEKGLKLCKGRVEGPFGVAKMLNINPNTLRARMRKLGIKWENFRPE